MNTRLCSLGLLLLLLVSSWAHARSARSRAPRVQQATARDPERSTDQAPPSDSSNAKAAPPKAGQSTTASPTTGANPPDPPPAASPPQAAAPDANERATSEAGMKTRKTREPRPPPRREKKAGADAEAGIACKQEGTSSPGKKPRIICALRGALQQAPLAAELDKARPDEVIFHDGVTVRCADGADGAQRGGAVLHINATRIEWRGSVTFACDGGPPAAPTVETEKPRFCVVGLDSKQEEQFKRIELLPGERGADGAPGRSGADIAIEADEMSFAPAARITIHNQGGPGGAGSPGKPGQRKRWVQTLAECEREETWIFDVEDRYHSHARDGAVGQQGPTGRPGSVVLRYQRGSDSCPVYLGEMRARGVCLKRPTTKDRLGR